MHLCVCIRTCIQLLWTIWQLISGWCLQLLLHLTFFCFCFWFVVIVALVLIWDKVSNWRESSPFWLDWLVRTSPRTYRIRWCSTPVFYSCAMDLCLEPHGLHSRLFTHWIISLATHLLVATGSPEVKYKSLQLQDLSWRKCLMLSLRKENAMSMKPIGG